MPLVLDQKRVSISRSIEQIEKESACGREEKGREEQNRSGERFTIEEHEPEMDGSAAAARTGKATTRGKKRMEGSQKRTPLCLI